MQQELGAREQTVAAMKASGDIPAAHLEELENTWDRVNHLADIREGRLRESLKLVSTRHMWIIWTMLWKNIVQKSMLEIGVIDLGNLNE